MAEGDIAASDATTATTAAPAATEGGPQADGPAPQADGAAPQADGAAPKADGAAPKAPVPAPKSTGPQNQVKDTLSKEKKKPEDEKDKSWTAQMNALAQGYMDNMVAPLNNMMTRGLLGATAQDFWDDPKKAAASMEKQIGDNINSVGNALNSAANSVSSAAKAVKNFFSKDNAPEAGAKDEGQLSDDGIQGPSVKQDGGKARRTIENPDGADEVEMDEISTKGAGIDENAGAIEMTTLPNSVTTQTATQSVAAAADDSALSAPSASPSTGPSPEAPAPSVEEGASSGLGASG